MLTFFRIFLCLILPVLGQVPLTTDRPDQTESAALVPLKSVQIETGISVEQTGFVYPNGRFDIRNYNILGTLVRYGLKSNVELRIATGYLYDSVKRDYPAFPGPDGYQKVNSELDDVSLGVKLPLLATENGLNGALLVAVQLPLGIDEQVRDKIGASAILALGHGLGRRFGVGYNLGAVRSTTGDRLLKYSAVMSAAVTGNAGLFIEFFGASYEKANPVLRWDTGITVAVNPTLQWDFFAGFPVNDYAPDIMLGAGLSIRFDR